MTDDTVQHPNWVHNLRGVLSGVPFTDEMRAAILACFNDFYRDASATLAENAALRQIIHDCAKELPNGAYVSPKASIEFMQGLPREIALVCVDLAAANDFADNASA